MRAPARWGRVFTDIETSAFRLSRMMARHLGALGGAACSIDAELGD
jgi:hypothetical protein